MKRTITLDEWRKAIEDAQRATRNGDADGVTVRDIAAATGLSISRVRQMLSEMVRAGLAKHVGERQEVRMDGRPCGMPLYRLVKGKKR